MSDLKVLYAFDGSDISKSGIEFVSSLSANNKLVVKVLTVAEPCPNAIAELFNSDLEKENRELAIKTAQETLDKALKLLDIQNVVVESENIVGKAAEVIVEQAQSWQADLIIMGRRGIGPIQSRLMGSVSRNVYLNAPCPLLIVNTPPKKPLTIVTGSDGSDGALGVLKFLCKLKLSKDTTFHIQTVREENAYFQRGSSVFKDKMDEILKEYYGNAARISKETLEQVYSSDHIHGHIHSGTEPASKFLVESAEDCEADLLVIGSRGLGAVSRFFTGSVSHTALETTTRNLLIVPRHS